MIVDPWFYVAAIPAVLITGVAKGGFGGVAILAVPLLALVISPVQAAGIMLPILVAMDLSGLVAYRGNFDKRNLWILLPGAIVGIAVGGLTAHWVDDNFIRAIVGAIAILFTLHYVFKGRTAGAVKNPNVPAGVFLGAFSGYTSFVAHAGAPSYQLYMLPQKLDRGLYAGTSVIFFSAVNAIKLIPYGMLGMLQLGNLTTSAVLLPLAPVGVALGVWLNKKLPNEIFYRIIYTAVFLVGVKLIWDVVVG